MEKLKNEYLCKMSVDDFMSFKDEESVHFAVAKFDFLKTSINVDNAHKHKISKEVLMRDASSFLGKLIVGKYNPNTNDLEEHELDEVILGYISPSPLQEVQFYEDEDGETHAVVLGLISKLYATDVYELFQEHNHRNVSVEMLVHFSEETNGILNGTDYKEIVEFDGAGITILGLAYNPSVKGSNMTMVQFSEDEVKDVMKKYQENTIQNKILTKLSNIEDKLNERGEGDLKKDEKLEKFEDEELETEYLEKPEPEPEPEQEEEVEKAEEEQAEEQAEEEKETFSELKSKYEALVGEKESLQDKIGLLEAEITKLSTYKEKVEMAEKEVIVNKTLSEIEDFVEDSKYSELKEQGLACKLCELETWSNALIASYFKVLKASKQESGILDTKLPQKEQINTNSIW